MKAVLPPQPSGYVHEPHMTCSVCRAENQVLHHDPDRPNECRRTMCGKCQGETNGKRFNRSATSGRGGFE